MKRILLLDEWAAGSLSLFVGCELMCVFYGFFDIYKDVFVYIFCKQ